MKGRHKDLAKPENDLYDLHLNKGKNGDLDTLDPQLQLGTGWLVHARLYATGAIVSCGSSGKQSLLRAVDLTKGHCLPNGRSRPVGFHCFVGKTLGEVFLVKGH
ncbi:hypothetical protein Tco_0463571 [Tanacetum coccineum]